MNIVNPSDRTTLLLNAAWLPINIVTARAACNHMITGRASIVDRFGNIHNIHCGGASEKNIHDLDWFSQKAVLETGEGIEDSFYVADQPVLRSAHDFWPLPTIALTTSRFFKKSRRGKPSLAVLAKLYKNTCQICLRKFPTSKLTLEHIHPKAHGGPLDDWNVLPTCEECNRMKADIYPYFDVNGTDLHDKVKKIPSFFIPYVSDIREEWEQLLFRKKV